MLDESDESAGEPYELRDLDNSCGDPECCGGPYPQLYVWLPERRRWVSADYRYGREDVFIRRLKRWGVK